MPDPHFFGYGSLVNRQTHGFADAHRARLSGYRRAWRRTRFRPVAFLTAIPDPGCEIDGLIAAVPGADWAALDLRERAYDRVQTRAVTHDLPPETEIAVYAIPEGAHDTPTEENPFLLSYLDVVVQGYLTEFGEDGVARFFQTTSGWEAPVADDRASPIYPRARLLADDERALVDAWLERMGSPVISAARIPEKASPEKAS